MNDKQEHVDGLYRILDKRMSDERIFVHCLKCNDIYLETDPPVEVCPHCGNPDKQKTVYFQGETQ